MTSSSTDFLAALNEALQWKEDIGLPALEEVQQLKIHIDFYINQENVYKSQLEMLRNEMHEKLSKVTNNENDREDILFETKTHLRHMSRQNSFLSERLDTLEMADEYSQALNVEIMQLQKLNRELQESNQKYLQINQRLVAQQTTDKEEILYLNVRFNELHDEMLHMNDVFIDTKHKYHTVIEKTIAEKEQFIEKANIEYSKCVQGTNDDNDFYSNDQLIFARERTLSEASSNILALNNARSRSADGYLSPKIYATDNYSPSVNETENYINFNRKNSQSMDDEKQKEEEYEFVVNVNIYEIEIEGLNDKILKYKKKFNDLKVKYIQSEKNLSEMNNLYDKIYTDNRQLSSNDSFCFSCVHE